MANRNELPRRSSSTRRPRSGLRDATPLRGPSKRRSRQQPGTPWAGMLIVALVGVGLAVALWRLVLARPSEPASSSVSTPAAQSSVVPVATAQVDAREHRWLGRPLPRSAPRDFADRTYLFGASKNNSYRIHHGNDIVNPAGTPVQAAADGLVVFAGKDAGTRFGPATLPNFYGNLVLVKLPKQYHGMDVYYLNGHFDQVMVREGQQVKQGDTIGLIGMTGTADGPHLHFEVRVGGTTYANSRNASLWLRSLPGSGSLAGKITDRNGKVAEGVIVTLLKDITASDVQRHWGETPTYSNDPLGKLNADEDWGENVAFGDLPVGEYEVRVNLSGQTYVRHVTIRDGRTMWLAIQEGSALE